jgi:hypothetical protein
MSNGTLATPITLTLGTSGSLSLDGYAVSSATCSSSPCTLSITTTQSNDMIFVFASANVGGSFFTPTDGQGLTWNTRYSCASSGRLICTYWAKAPNPLTGDTVSVSFSGGVSSARLLIVAVNGANTASPFDPNGALPNLTTSGSSCRFTTTNPDDFLISVVEEGGLPALGAPSGFTSLDTTTYGFESADAYQIVSALQSGTVEAWQGAGGATLYCDAIQVGTSSSGGTTKVYVDSGSAWTVTPNPLGGSGPQEQWAATSASGGTISGVTVATVTYQHQYLLTVTPNPSAGGTVSPSSGTWYSAGAVAPISASANLPTYTFNGWTGTGTCAYTGTSDPASVAMNCPATETANFGPPITYPVTIQYNCNPGPCGPPTWTLDYGWISFGTCNPSDITPAPLGTGAVPITQAANPIVISSPAAVLCWEVPTISPSTGVTFISSAAGLQQNSITGPVTFTVTLTNEFQLTMQQSCNGVGCPGGTGNLVSYDGGSTWLTPPATAWYVAGTVVNIGEFPGPTYFFDQWFSSGSGGTPPNDQNQFDTITMNSAITETANYLTGGTIDTAAYNYNGAPCRPNGASEPGLTIQYSGAFHGLDYVYVVTTKAGGVVQLSNVPPTTYSVSFLDDTNYVSASYTDGSNFAVAAGQTINENVCYNGLPSAPMGGSASPQELGALGLLASLVISVHGNGDKVSAGEATSSGDGRALARSVWKAVHAVGRRTSRRDKVG